MIGQLSKAGIRVPGGFATTADAFREFLDGSALAARIEARLKGLDADDVAALGRCGAEIRGWIEATPFPRQLEAEIAQGFRELTGGDESVSVAVRSSATAEDLPDASFAGQQETFLNIRGLPNVMTALKQVFASLYNDRAISYRIHKGFGHSAVALSAGVQRMARSDLAASGVMFTLDTESGFRGPFGEDLGRARGRSQPLLPHRRGRDRAGASRAQNRGALPAADGHRVGEGRLGRQDLHPAGETRDREIAQIGGGAGAVPVEADIRSPRHGPRDRSQDRRGYRAR